MVVVVVGGGSVMMIGGLGVLGPTGVPSEDKNFIYNIRFLPNDNFLSNCKGLNIGFQYLSIAEH